MKNEKYYLITIKTRGRTYTTPQQLHIFYSLIKSSLHECEWSDLKVMEFPKTHRLHLHTICITSANMFSVIKKYNKKNIYMHFKEFPHTDYSKVRDYLLKQVPNHMEQESIIDLNIFSHNNIFQNPFSKFLHHRNYNTHPIRHSPVAVQA